MKICMIFLRLVKTYCVIKLFLAKLEDNEEFDQPICSFLCGKKIMTPGSSNDGYISSPGFFTGQSYPPHLKCEWIFNGTF